MPYTAVYAAVMNAKPPIQRWFPYGAMPGCRAGCAGGRAARGHEAQKPPRAGQRTARCIGAVAISTGTEPLDRGCSMTPVSTRITIDPAVCHGKPCIRGSAIRSRPCPSGPTTKDDDFVQSRLVRGRPRRLWLIATGNVDNRSLEAMIRAALPKVQQAFETSSFIELGPGRLTVREGRRSGRTRCVVSRFTDRAARPAAPPAAPPMRPPACAAWPRCRRACRLRSG